MNTRHIIIIFFLVAAVTVGLFALQWAGFDLATLRTQINQGTLGVPEVVPEEIPAAVTTTCDVANLYACQKDCADEDTDCREECQSGCVGE